MGKLLPVFSAVLLFCAASCKDGSEQASIAEPEGQEKILAAELPPLAGGEVFYKGKDLFGGTMELQGDQLIADTVIFKVQGAQALVKDSALVLKTGQRILEFRLPDLKYVRDIGTFGQGPDEFMSPVLSAAREESLLGYVFETLNSKLYSLDKEGKVHRYPFFEPQQGGGFRFSQKELAEAGSGDFVYADASPSGKSIFRAVKQGDSLDVREVYNLALNPKNKSWMAYVGDFVANTVKGRMAYAYKYFKILKFMDMEGRTVKTLNFEREEYDETTAYRVDGMDANVTHYWGGCATDDYAYFLYSGRTPADVWKEGKAGINYIYVEQYDWNGNPVRRYKLDQWGYFTVDGKNNKLYLLSTQHDDPFFVYDLPN